MNLVRRFTVEGKPVPAVRMTQKTTWKPAAQRYLAYKEKVGRSYQSRFPGVDPFTGVVGIRVVVHLREPGKRKWDVTNVLKACEDGLNRVAYLDDKQIVDAHITVLPHTAPMDAVEIMVTGIRT